MDLISLNNPISSNIQYRLLLYIQYSILSPFSEASDGSPKKTLLAGDILVLWPQCHSIGRKHPHLCFWWFLPSCWHWDESASIFNFLHPSWVAQKWRCLARLILESLKVRSHNIIFSTVWSNPFYNAVNCSLSLVFSSLHYTLLSPSLPLGKPLNNWRKTIQHSKTTLDDARQKRKGSTISPWTKHDFKSAISLSWFIYIY